MLTPLSALSRKDTIMIKVHTRLCLRCREVQICECPGNAIWVPIEIDYEELRKLIPRGEKAYGKPVISAETLVKHIELTHIKGDKDETTN